MSKKINFCSVHFIIAGQNLAIWRSTGSFSVEETVIEMGSSWFESEYKNGQYFGWMDIINKFFLPKDP